MKNRILRFLIPLFVLCMGLHGQEKDGVMPSADKQWADFLTRHLWEVGFSNDYLNERSKIELKDITGYINSVRTALEKGIHRRWFGNEPQVQHIFQEPVFMEGKTRENFHFAEELHKLKLWEIGLYAFKMSINHADTGKRVKLYTNLGGTNMEHVKFLAQLDKSDKYQ